MPLPSSGPLSFSAIRAEVVPGGTNSNVSLRTLSSTAGFSTPDAVSEFYGYGSITYSYYGTWALDDPCNYDYYDIYSASDGKYYVDNGGYLLMYEFAPGSIWYEFLYYEPLFPANIYNSWTINSTSTTLIDGGLSASPC